MDVGVEAGVRELGDGGITRLADERRHGDLPLAARHEDRDQAPPRLARSGRRLLLVHVAALDVAVGQSPHPRLESVAVDCGDSQLLEDPLVVLDGDRFVCVELVLDVVVEEPRSDAERDRDAEREKPRPPGSPASNLALVRSIPLVAAVATGRREGRRRSRLAAEHHRRGLLGLGSDRLAAAHELEVAVHFLRSAVPVRRLLRQRAEHDEVEIPRDLTANRGGRLRDLREVLHRDLDRRLAGERHLPGEQLVEQDPGRVEVGRLVDGRAAGLLGGEVLGGADDRARLGHLARTGSRDPEVRHLDAALVVDEDVVRLDVPVDDPVAMGVAERGQHLAHVRHRDRDRARAARDDQLLQRAPLDVLHDDEVRPLYLSAVVDRDDVRVREARGMRRLATEPLDELRVVRVPLVEHLDRDLATELLILGEPDVGHAAAPELALEPVPAGKDGAASLVDGRHVREA